MVRRLSGACLGALLALVIFMAALAQTAPFTGTTTRPANLRSGPGTTYALSGTLRAGDVVTVTEVTKTRAGTWYRLSSGKWVAAYLVKPTVPAATAAVTSTGGLAPTTRNAPVSAAELAAYLDSINQPTTDLGGAAREMGRLLGAPQVGDSTWTVRLGTQLAIVKLAHEQLLAVQPPPSLAAVHAILTTATQQCSDSADATAAAVDHGDVQALNRAIKLMQGCAAGVVLWSEKIDALQGK